MIKNLEGGVCQGRFSAREKALNDASGLVPQGDKVGENRRGWCFEIMDKANRMF